MDQRALLEAVIDIACHAGDAILEIYQRDDHGVTDKADTSPLTAADLAAHHLIVAELARLTPEIPLLSEESGGITTAERRSWQRYWLIDPLDGTKEFINRNGEFTVNIALIEAGCPVLGVVHVPVQQRTYAGAQGLGAQSRQSGQPARTIQVRPLAPRLAAQQPVVVVGSRRHGTEQLEACIERIRAKLGPVELTNMGSSLKICLVAAGEADLYPRLGPTCEWDTAAAQAVLEAAGGMLTDPQLQPLRYNQKEELLNPFFYAMGDRGIDWRSVLL
ncbi:MAG: 3'(2'),5'-bisphosphate nucleotidase CysQ [Pseudomonadales bacterium]|jgi:3'(2'), 5'-bisphosphate nucleotidase|nr:3'(2'),5'-bisphosphate nucleotidase CysQ [Pseudomonadales bacterium]MCC6530058.1 3'(2'),5'-bisphosphate nucleotidase CysQ [Pseudomonadales bacterium]MCP5332151.1 3'(2'),5'-bisphosphate nucleotidase CysQ [Pseudomonadales bacterium]HMU91017.1 3'(2'),5'-bisphosphate nucleotidase CysQ [Pseudomonadales bacterium]HMW14167.1 3'(2'),5'-bisphosphate nucleotidase CysQ [Pseudomonadales bacterium]